LRAAGLGSISLDLMYGLPHQTVESVEKSTRTALQLMPDRIALFGYAHVPWMKRHQSLLPEAFLPDATQRLHQAQAAAQAMVAAGYVAIGLDHFSLPADPLARSRGVGRLRRNFQGYTTDKASTLVGFGTSSIGTLPQGYVQNAASTVAYRDAVANGRLATARGVALTIDDRFRRAVIERLMCDLSVDLESLALAHGSDPESLLPELARIDTMAGDGIVGRKGYRIAVPDAGRPFLRAICSVFDSHLSPEGARHSRAF
jgi:oxygen-independent coproporphyrinogen-3 oxidase